MISKITFSKTLLVICFLVTQIVLLKTETSAQKVRLTAGLGVSDYNGDLAVGYTPTFKPAFSIGASYDVTNRYRFRLNLSQMSIHGEDASSPIAANKQRNLDFKTNITEAAILGELDLLDNTYNAVIPYVFAGVSVFHFDPHPETLINGQDVSLHDLGTEGQFLKGQTAYTDRKYSLTQLNLQFGGGIRYEISENFSLAFEASYRRLFTDYLDDVSADRYVTPAQWQISYKATGSVYDAYTNPSLAQQYAWRAINLKNNPPTPVTQGTNQRYRGNPNNNDTYYTYQIRVNIRLNHLLVGDDLYSPRNPSGHGQLRCAKRVF